MSETSEESCNLMMDGQDRENLDEVHGIIKFTGPYANRHASMGPTWVISGYYGLPVMGIGQNVQL